MAERLLVVDDDADTLKLVVLMLSRQGYEVISAERGVKALELIKSEKPDLILLDVMMPDLDGYEVARRLRADSETEDIPIIMFTAKTQVEDKITGLEAGADAYLTKPTQPRELFAQVKAVLGRAKKSRPVEPQVPAGDRGLVISILGAKGGLGVSTVAVNLGVILHKKRRESVWVAELRPGFGGISMGLGYSNPEGLKRLLNSNPDAITPREIEMSVVTHSSGVKMLLASPHPKEAVDIVKIQNFDAIFKHLPFLAKFIILDLGPALPPVSQAALKISDEVIVLIEPSPKSVAQTKLLLNNLFEVGVGEGRVRVVLVNRVRSSVQLNWSQVQDELGVKIVTVITPAPELAYQSLVASVPMVVQQPGSITTQQFEKLVEVVTEQV